MLWSHISSSRPHSSHAAAVHSQQRRKLFLFSRHPPMPRVASGWRLFPQGAMKSQSSTFQTLEIYMICSNLKSIEELFYAQYHCQHIPSQLNKSPFHLISDIHLTSNCFPKTFRRSSPSMIARGWWRHYLYSFRSGLWAVISELDMCHLVHQAQLNFLDFCVLQKFTLSYAQLLISRKSMQLRLLYRFVQILVPCDEFQGWTGESERRMAHYTKLQRVIAAQRIFVSGASIICQDRGSHVFYASHILLNIKYITQLILCHTFSVRTTYYLMTSLKAEGCCLVLIANKYWNVESNPAVHPSCLKVMILAKLSKH